MEEIWKSVKDFENYEVSTHGNVRNKKTNRILKPFNAAQKKYKMVSLGAGNKRYIHRIVCQTFLENNDTARCFVDHIDRNNQNNKLENLRWVTFQQNMWNTGAKNIIAYRNGFRVSYRTSCGLDYYKQFKTESEAKEYLEFLKNKFPRIM